MVTRVDSSAGLVQVRQLPGGPRRPDLRPIYEPVIFALVLTIAFFVSPPNLQYVLSIGVIYALLATSLGVLFGWSGIYSFGHAAFFGMGAYTTALLRNQEWDALVFLGVSFVIAAAAAFLIALIGIRLVKVEFAMLTMIVGQICYLLTFRVPELEGDNGIYGVPRGQALGIDVTSNQAFWFYAIIVIAVVLGIMRRVHLSAFGESLNALRDDPVKAAAIGLPVRHLRIAAFALAGGVAGLAGGLFAQQGGIVTPTSLSFTFSGVIIIMSLLGGMARFWGPAIGAIAFQLINAFVFASATHANLYLGLILLAVVLIFPSGILGVLARLVDRHRERRAR